MAQLSPGKVVLLGILLLVAVKQGVEAQRPVLNLFQGGGDEATFLVPFGSGEPYTLRLVTNTVQANLVTEPVERITVTINGGSDTDRIEADPPSGTSISLNTVNNQYEFELVATGGEPATTEQYQGLLASLRYVSTLSNDSLLAPPPNITIIAASGNVSSEPATARLLLVPSNRLPPSVELRIPASVNENAQTGASVTQLNATDPEGQGVTYSFQTASSVFSVSSDGLVTVLDPSSLDYETPSQRRFDLVIIVADRDPISPMTSETTLAITVNNVNDNPPRFTARIYNFSVTEGVANVEVGTISATDEDQEPNTNTLGIVFFEIVNPSSEIVQNFQLNRGTGIITVQDPGLDFESIQAYSFQVQATDGTFTDTATVQVRVIDIPDNRPVISPATKTILIDLDVRQRQVFLTEGSGGQLMVSDSDSQFLQDGVATLTVTRGPLVN